MSLRVTPGPARAGSQTYYVHEGDKKFTVVYGTGTAGVEVFHCVTCGSAKCAHVDVIRNAINALK